MLVSTSTGHLSHRPAPSDGLVVFLTWCSCATTLQVLRPECEFEVTAPLTAYKLPGCLHRWHLASPASGMNRNPASVNVNGPVETSVRSTSIDEGEMKETYPDR